MIIVVNYFQSSNISISRISVSDSYFVKSSTTIFALEKRTQASSIAIIFSFQYLTVNAKFVLSPKGIYSTNSQTPVLSSASKIS